MSRQWHSIDQAAALQLTQLTSTPGQVVQLATSMLPAPLQEMPGVVSYYASSYINAATGKDVMVGGAMVVVRTEQATSKAYGFAFASSSDGKVCFAGPVKDFPAHHVQASNSVPIAAMFGQIQFPKPKV